MSAPPISERHKMQFHRQAPIKELVRVATTANITISTALNNGDTLDGISLVTGDRVLVKDQSSGAQNGIYVVGTSPARDYDVSTDDPGFGYLVVVLQGTVNAGTLWRNTNTSAPTIGSTALTFTQFAGSGVSAGPITSSGLTMATARLLGRTTASTGAIEEITVGSGLSLSAGALTATGSGATITVKDEGSTQSTTVDTLDFVGAGVVASGGGSTATITISGGGGGGSSAPVITQTKQSTTTATSLVLTNTPINGHSIILVSNATTGQITAVTQTNVTWTQMKTVTSGGSSFYAIWVGVVGASPSATINWTKPGSFATILAIEVTDTLAGTVGANASSTTNNTQASITTTGTRLVVGAGGCDVTTVIGTALISNLVAVDTGANFDSISVSYATTSGFAIGQFLSANAGAYMICEIT